MQQKLSQLKFEFSEKLEKISNQVGLEDLKLKYLARKGRINELMKEIANLPADQKPQIGALFNQVKKDLQEMVASKEREWSKGEASFLDVTLPGKKPPIGHHHLVTGAINEITEIFKRIGFTRVRYPEVETDWYSFGSLNMPPDHPARDEWETFFVESENKSGTKIVLTPHTSSGQAREMEKKKLPIRMINISKCYRRQIDVSHTPMFHQFEGLYIDKKVTVAHLKGVFDFFVKSYFGPDRETRLRPFHFQFTEPSFELDISCDLCGGEGCKMCKEGWLELGGAGMVHPNVLKSGKVDTKKYNGFAFGWGVERTLVMKPGLELDDIRFLYKNDLRFLEQF